MNRVPATLAPTRSGLRVAIGTDGTASVVARVRDYLRGAGHHLDDYSDSHDIDGRLPVGGGEPPPQRWVQVATDVAWAVAERRADVGVLLCFTGTGMTIAANKIPGVRAALCADAATATGARRWNDANVCVLSYRLATATTAAEILTAFLSTGPDPTTARALKVLHALETSRS
jgi:ribose 5-phosphate isomerase B